MRRRLPTILAGGLLAAGLVACGNADDATDSTSGTVAHVGDLPDLQTGRGPDGRPAAVGDVVPVGAPDSVPTASTSATDETEPDETEPDETEPDGTEPDGTEPDDTDPDDTIEASDATVGEAADGNRILALGDSIMAAVGPQYGGQLCEVLEDQGWFLGVDAFQGRAIDAGLTVLREDIEIGDWDAAIVNLGSNYRGDADAYAEDLRQILDRLGSMPVVLVTVTEFQEDIAEVNFVIRDLARDRDQVWVLEWSEITRDDGSLTGGDGLHLSEPGRAELAAQLGDVIGDAPRAGGAEPGCDLLRDAAADGPSGDGASAPDTSDDAGGG